MVTQRLQRCYMWMIHWDESHPVITPRSDTVHRCKVFPPIRVRKHCINTHWTILRNHCISIKTRADLALQTKSRHDWHSAACFQAVFCTSVPHKQADFNGLPFTPAWAASMYNLCESVNPLLLRGERFLFVLSLILPICQFPSLLFKQRVGRLGI